MLSHNTLDNKKILSLITKLKGKKRLDAIIEQEKPIEFIKSLTPCFILQTIFEVGKEDALELIELLPGKTVRAIFDLEIWQKERINIKKAGEFFSLLFHADRERAVKQIEALDIELIGLFFKMAADIYDVTLGEEPLEFGNFYSTSPDGRFLIVYKDKSDFAFLAHGLEQYLSSLYERDMAKALRILESVRFELVSNLEEEALKWRNTRLSDMGILPREERLAYFSRLEKLEPKKHQTVENIININNNENFLTVQEINNTESNLIYHIQNMHMDLLGDFADEEKIHLTARYVKLLIDLGLGDKEKLSDYDIKDVIRFGRTYLLKLKSMILAIKNDNKYLLGENFSLLDSPLCEVARGLIKPEPLYYEGLLDVKKLTFRFFQNINEVNASLQAVLEIKFRSLLLGSLGFLVGQKDIKSAKITHSTLLAQKIKEFGLDKDIKIFCQDLAQKTNLPLDKIENFTYTVLTKIENQDWVI